MTPAEKNIQSETTPAEQILLDALEWYGHDETLDRHFFFHVVGTWPGDRARKAIAQYKELKQLKQVIDGVATAMSKVGLSKDAVVITTDNNPAFKEIVFVSEPALRDWPTREQIEEKIHSLYGTNAGGYSIFSGAGFASGVAWVKDYLGHK